MPCSDTSLSLFVQMQHRGHLGTDPECQGQNGQQGLRSGCVQHCPGSVNCSGDPSQDGQADLLHS